MTDDSHSANARDIGAKTVRPNGRFRAGSVEAMRALGGEIQRHRSHIATIFSGEFKSASRGTWLGQFWNVILPLVPISVYLLLVQLRVFPSYDGLDPAVYIGFNVTLWYLMVGMIQRPMTVVKHRIAETMKTALPLSVAIASSFAQLLFDTLVRTILVIVLILFLARWPLVHPLWLVFAVVSATIFCFSIGLILSIFNAVFADVERVTNILLQYGIFVSGVIFPISSMGPLAWLETYNPLAVFLSAIRSSFFFAQVPSALVLCIWSAAGLVLSAIAVRFFYVMERRIRSLV